MGWLEYLTHIVIIRYRAADLLKNGLQIGWFGVKTPQKQLQNRYFASIFATDWRSEILGTYVQRFPNLRPTVLEPTSNGSRTYVQRFPNLRPTVPEPMAISSGTVGFSHAWHKSNRRVLSAPSTCRFGSIDVSIKPHRRVVLHRNSRFGNGSFGSKYIISELIWRICR